MSVHFAARTGIVLLIGGLLSPMPPTVMAQEQPEDRQQIAVVDFSYGDTRSPHYASYKNVGVSKGVSAQMVAALATEDAYVVIDPSRVREAFQRLNLTRPLGTANAMQLGEYLNADVVLTGAVTEFQVEQVCEGGSQCSPETKAQVAIESSVIEVDSGRMTTRRSDVNMTREQSGNPVFPANHLGAEPQSGRNVLDDAVDKAIANLVKGLTGEPDSIEFRRNRYPW